MKIKTQNPVMISISVFVGLAVIFAILLFVAKGLGEPFAQTILVSLGSAIFSSGLTFFLLRLTSSK